VTLAIGLAGTPNILNRTLDLNQTRCITINQKTQIIMNIVNILLAVLLPILIMSISGKVIFWSKMAIRAIRAK
jgi:Na+/H+-translocating membrane pyrophosphatase